MVSKEKIELLRQKIDEADAIVVGGASGMSAASGFVFYYQEDDVFRRMAGSLAKKYDRHNMFDLFYDRRPSRGEQWALMLRVIHYIYECYTGETYTAARHTLHIRMLYRRDLYGLGGTAQREGLLYCYDQSGRAILPCVPCRAHHAHTR